MSDLILKKVQEETDASCREYVMNLLGGEVGPSDEELKEIANLYKAGRGEIKLKSGKASTELAQNQ